MHLHSKVHDLIAATMGSGTIAVVLSDVDMFLKVAVSAATLIFLLVGIVARVMDLLSKRKPKDD